METRLTGSLTSTAYKLAQNNKRHSQEVGDLLSYRSPSENCTQYVIHQDVLFGSVTEGRSLPNQHSVILYIDSISLSIHGPIPLRPLSTTTASSPTGDSPCSWNTDFWFGNFRVNHSNHLENLGVCQNVNYLELISDGLSLLVPATSPLPFLTTMWLIKARPSAYQGTPNPGQGTQNIFPSNLRDRGINSLCSL